MTQIFTNHWKSITHSQDLRIIISFILYLRVIRKKLSICVEVSGNRVVRVSKYRVVLTIILTIVKSCLRYSLFRTIFFFRLGWLGQASPYNERLKYDKFKIEKKKNDTILLFCIRSVTVVRKTTRGVRARRDFSPSPTVPSRRILTPVIISFYVHSRSTSNAERTENRLISTLFYLSARRGFSTISGVLGLISICPGAVIGFGLGGFFFFSIISTSALPHFSFVRKPYTTRTIII